MDLIENKDIKIPEKHYVGFQIRGGNEIPLGFMTPDGTDSGAVGRKSTVDRWASKTVDSKSIDNKPMSGFKMGRSVKHQYGWGKGNVAWRIEDPRGFELEISSPNLANLMSISTIENGEILEKCVWGRLKAENILIPVSSDIYKNAVTNTERVKKSVSLKDVKPGYKVTLQNGDEGIYYGYMYIVSKGDLESNYCKISSKKKHIIVKNAKGSYDTRDRVDASTSLKISEILDETTVWTPVQAEKMLNDKLNDTKLSVDHYDMVGVAVRIFDTIKLAQTLEQIDSASLMVDPEQYLKSAKGGGFNNIVIKNIATNTWALVQSYYISNRHYNRNSTAGNIFDYNKLISDQVIKFSKTTRRGYSYNTYSSGYEVNNTMEIDLTNPSSFESYLLFYKINTTDGSEIILKT